MKEKDKKVINIIRRLENNLIEYKQKLRQLGAKSLYVKALVKHRHELEKILDRLVTNRSRYKALDAVETLAKIKSFRELGYKSKSQVMSSSRYFASYRLIKKFPRLQISLELALSTVVRLNQYYLKPLERRLRRKKCT